MCVFSGSTHRFSAHRVGRNIVLRNSDCLAVRQSGYDGGVVVSSQPLRTDELLQVIDCAISCHKNTCDFSVVGCRSVLTLDWLTVYRLTRLIW